MSKYKLIKCYPGSLELSTIVEYYPNWNMYGICNNCLYDKQLIENNPEFWEKIIEKDYEILSFKIPGNDHWRVTLQTNGMYDGWSAHHALNESRKGNWSIYQVRRLSDGEIFTVGDAGRSISITKLKSKHKIKGFRLMQKQNSINRTYYGPELIWIDWENDEGGNWLDSTELLKPLAEQMFDTFYKEQVNNGTADGAIWEYKDDIQQLMINFADRSNKKSIVLKNI